MARRSFRRIIRTLAAMVALPIVMLAPATASAAPPLRFSAEVDVTGYAAGLSATCGFDVFVTIQGTANAILFLDADASAIVREIDWNAGWTRTYVAPSLGTAYTQRFGGPLLTSYPNGTDVGDAAVAVVAGTGGRIGDDPAEAGRVVYDAVIVFVDPATGIPAIDFVGVESATGHFIGDNNARRCATLAA
jgi:hypothetical protein